MRVGTIVRAVIVVLVVGGAIVAYVFRDQLTGAASDLRVGDCFEVPTAEQVEDVQHKPCTEPHTGEVIAVFDYPNPPEAWPGASAFEDIFRTECLDNVFLAYTGFAFDTPQAEQIDAGFFYPLQESWGQDKEITCYAAPLDGKAITFSYKAASG